jgi:retron-type reverse transcriptase
LKASVTDARHEAPPESTTESRTGQPQRRTHQAMDKVKEALLSGKVEVVDADLSSYFDVIPHRQLLRQVAKRVSEGSVLRLIKAWLRAPIVEEDRTTGRRKVLPNRCGTPQTFVRNRLRRWLWRKHGRTHGLLFFTDDRL